MEIPNQAVHLVEKPDLHETAKFYRELLAEALIHIEEEFRAEGGSAYMVSGPIGSGATLQPNIDRIKNTIARLRQNGIPVLDQTRWHNSNFTDMNLVHSNELKLEEFYKPLIRSGRIKGLYMLPGWEQSSGATVEHAEATRLNLPIKYLEASDLTDPEY